MARGGGRGRTPKKVQELLSAAIKELGVRKVATDTNLWPSAVHRYSQGTGEPTTETLEKLAKYFKTRVEFLRGEFSSLDNEIENLKWFQSLEGNENLSEWNYASTDKPIPSIEIYTIGSMLLYLVQQLEEGGNSKLFEDKLEKLLCECKDLLLRYNKQGA